MKTKKAMKKITHIGMAALVAMVVIGAACSKIESPEIETPETQKENIVTLTTTVGFDDAAGTRALTSTGVKTFAVGEKMALRYKNKKGDWVKAVSNALEAGDIADGSKSATFTFTLDNPDKTQNVDYIYPAAIVNELGNMNEAALFGSQDGTLNTIASTFDYSRKIGAWDGDNLPSLTLENQLAILAITLKNADGSSDITSSITGLTLSYGTKTYNVNRSAAAGPIYVAIYPTAEATITVTATDGTKNYTKTLTDKTYAKGNGYPVSWRMTPAPTARALAEATTDDIGKIAGADGNIYDSKDAAEAAGTTAVAMIAYVGTASDCTNGLAIALADESDTKDYGAAGTACSGKAAVTGGTWRLPSIKDWQYMFIGCGASVSYSDDPIHMSYSYSGLASKLTTAQGDALQTDYYWSSTEKVPDTDAWYVIFDGSNANFDYDYEDDECLVRACLAF